MRDTKPQMMKPGGKPGGLNAEIQSRIGHQLRAMYDDVVRQGVPDRFAELIQKLDSADNSGTSGTAHASNPAAPSNLSAKTDGRD